MTVVGHTSIIKNVAFLLGTNIALSFTVYIALVRTSTCTCTWLFAYLAVDVHVNTVRAF